ncbi:MAG: cytochrome P450, partial [Myxococcota bacterium]
MANDFNPILDINCDDPYSVYRRLRDEAPVQWSAEAEMFCVSRYADVLDVLKDAQLFSSSGTQSVVLRNIEVPINLSFALKLFRFVLKTRINPFRIAQAGNLITMDPPRHDVLRKIVARGFTPRRIAEWEPRIRDLVEERLVDLRNGERFDVVSDLATPLPTTVIAEMLGFEPDRRDDFKRWSRLIIDTGTGVTDIRESDVTENLAELYSYLKRIIRARRQQPRDDLISTLVDPSQDGVLDELDVVQFVVLLLVAGNETTTNLIGNAVHALMDRPDQIELLVREPERID